MNDINSYIDKLSGKILLVDDSDEIRDMIKIFLKKTDIEVTEADNGEDAVKKYSSDSTHFNLIVMDIEMPVMNGYQATMKIREIEELNNSSPIPILALTAHSKEESEQACKDAGYNDQIIKPIKKIDLLQIISKYLGE